MFWCISMALYMQEGLVITMSLKDKSSRYKINFADSETEAQRKNNFSSKN